MRTNNDHHCTAWFSWFVRIWEDVDSRLKQQALVPLSLQALLQVSGEVSLRKLQAIRKYLLKGGAIITRATVYILQTPHFRTGRVRLNNRVPLPVPLQRVPGYPRHLNLCKSERPWIGVLNVSTALALSVINNTRWLLSINRCKARSCWSPEAHPVPDGFANGLRAVAEH